MKQIDHQAADQAYAALHSALPKRPAFDRDYGSFSEHPADPRSVPDEEVDEMLSAIDEAEAVLAMARAALEGYGNKVSTLTARSLMNEAREYLEAA